jgi:hypothetical protein
MMQRDRRGPVLGNGSRAPEETAEWMPERVPGTTKERVLSEIERQPAAPPINAARR